MNLNLPPSLAGISASSTALHPVPVGTGSGRTTRLRVVTAIGPQTGPLAPGVRPRGRRGAFTLVEMLGVLGVVALMLGLVLPALVSFKGSEDVTAAAYDLAGMLANARNYAMANNTYTWVGFYEQDYNSTSPPASAQPPPYTGVGHLTIGIVYSTSGGKLEDDTTALSEPLPTPGVNPPTPGFSPVGKLLQIYAVHLTALPAPPSGSANSQDPVVSNTLAGRPYQNNLDPATLEQTLISSDSADTTLRPFTLLGYTFYKTIRFNPRGEANINSTLPCTKIIELGLQPTHGNLKNTTTPNVVAVQQAGIGGAVNIYRR